MHNFNYLLIIAQSLINLNRPHAHSIHPSFIDIFLLAQKHFQSTSQIVRNTLIPFGLHSRRSTQLHDDGISISSIIHQKTQTMPQGDSELPSKSIWEGTLNLGWVFFESWKMKFKNMLTSLILGRRVHHDFLLWRRDFNPLTSILIFWDKGYGWVDIQYLYAIFPPDLNLEFKFAEIQSDNSRLSQFPLSTSVVALYLHLDSNLHCLRSHLLRSQIIENKQSNKAISHSNFEQPQQLWPLMLLADCCFQNTATDF